MENQYPETECFHLLLLTVLVTAVDILHFLCIDTNICQQTTPVQAVEALKQWATTVI
jgi:hypothetical protein